MEQSECLEACDQKTPGAFSATLDQLAESGQQHLVELPCLTSTMVHGALDRASMSVSKEQLETHIKFTSEFGKKGA